ncbi:MAG: carbon-nitrogen hydrolase family protein [Balneolaceae bacterium]|nr:carbon-nitrogen hydrolase family protein [Balneolaceae bacterium]
MKICIAQIKSIPGDIHQNIDIHKKYVDLAVSFGADAIFFPELSLTGYEPTLAKKLAINLDDKRLNLFQKISDSNQVVIGMGAPTRHRNGICISMIILQPNLKRHLYSKQYLHDDEATYFVSGNKSSLLTIRNQKFAMAICYEISVPAHCKTAYENGANIYLACVAKFTTGIDEAIKRLSHISDKYSMTVLMANSIGVADEQECAGKSSVWNNRGALLAQLDGSHEGILILDTQTQMVSEII